MADGDRCQMLEGEIWLEIGLVRIQCSGTRAQYSGVFPVHWNPFALLQPVEAQVFLRS